ncbi:MAG: Crp/Fnr family transcriptional regulator [Tannerellaceae bacterium]|nr:Crp/Fnr family transcriptional regulator [Tannerellaceae bacterium]
MKVTDLFTIPLFRNFTDKMKEDFLNQVDYTIEKYPKGEVVIQQGTTCNFLHILLEGKLHVDVMDVSGNIVRVETIKTPRSFATPHIFAEKNLFPTTFTVMEDITLFRGMKETVFTFMNKTPLFLQNFLCVSTSCNKCTMTCLRVLSFRSIRNKFIYYLFEHLKEGSDTVEMEHNPVLLADYLGVSRPALAKEIGKLIKDGDIKIDRGKVKIMNKQALSMML